MNDNEMHEDASETIAEGGKLVKARYKRTIDHTTVAPVNFDAECIGLDEIDERRAPEMGASRPRLVDDEVAKQQRNAAMAKANFDYSVLNNNTKSKLRVPIAANNNEPGFKETESRPLMEQLNRTVFEPDAVK